MITNRIIKRILRGGFREQKTRLQIDWLTHTDELILKHIATADRPMDPPTIASAIGRSNEYVADRCRQLAMRNLLERCGEEQSRYLLTDLGRRYLTEDIDLNELRNQSSTASD